jgi:uncharacterized protein YwgA
MKKELDKNTLFIILYLIEKLNGVLGKTHLQKMLFLIDLLSTKKFKKPLTILEFEKYYHGPYSKTVDDYTGHLEGKGLVEIREFPLQVQGKTYTRYYLKGHTSIKKNLCENIGAESVLLIDDIIFSYGNISLHEVLDIVYGLETVKDAELCKPLEMAKIIESDDGVKDIDIF